GAGGETASSEPAGPAAAGRRAPPFSDGCGRHRFTAQYVLRQHVNHVTSSLASVAHPYPAVPTAARRVAGTPGGDMRYPPFVPLVTVLSAGALVLTACGSPESAAGGDADGPIRIGLVYSVSGPLATYGEQYYQGFEAGLEYATGGTMEIDGRPVEVTTRDDAGDPTKAVSAARELIGEGYDIIAGSTASGVAVQVAPIAEQNDVLFISGPAATDAITGVNDHTFRSGRQTYQDILAAGSFLADPEGKKVKVCAQQTASGPDNVDAVTAVLEAEGAEVDSVLAPPDTTDLTPFAEQVRQAEPDLLFVAWAGETASAMWKSL